MAEINERAKQLLSQKTLAELQAIVINQLKCKAKKKTAAAAFLYDLEAREKAWAADIKGHSDGQRSSLIDEESSESIDDEKSVNLSDIKSENESIYWQENRGNVEAVDYPNTEKLFDHEFLDEFT